MIVTQDIWLDAKTNHLSQTRQLNIKLVTPMDEIGGIAMSPKPEKWLYDRWNSPVIRGNIVTQSDISIVVKLYNDNPYHDLFFTKEENGEITLSRHGIIVALIFVGY